MAEPLPMVRVVATLRRTIAALETCAAEIEAILPPAGKPSKIRPAPTEQGRARAAASLKRMEAKK